MNLAIVADILGKVFSKGGGKVASFLGSNGDKVADFAENNISNPVTDYQNYLKDNGYPENVVNGVPQGLNSGYSEVSDWINQFNQGAGKNNPINIPQTQEEIELARQGQFNSPLLVNGIQKNNKSLMTNVSNGINDFLMGYNENRNNAFMPSNLTDNKFRVGDNEYNKGAMGRLGEAVGTIARTSNKPIVKGLLNGVTQGVLMGNPLYGYWQGLNTATSGSNSDIYAQALKNQGIDVPQGIFNSYDANAFDSLMTPKYKEQENNLALQKLAEQQNYHDLMMKYYNDRLEETKRNNIANNATKNINANANMIRANKVGTGKSTTKKVQDNPDWNEDLSGYRARKYDDRYSDKLDLLKTSFIKKYGVDPDGYLKD